MTKDQIVNLLKSASCEVVFTKVDGSKRVMPCTLNESVIPPQPEKKTDRKKKSNDSVLSVWCLDKNEWRSFRLDNFVSIRVLPNE